MREHQLMPGVKETGDFQHWTGRRAEAWAEGVPIGRNLNVSGASTGGWLREYTFLVAQRGQAAGRPFKCRCVLSVKSEKKCNSVFRCTLLEHFQTITAIHFAEQSVLPIRFSPGLSGQIERHFVSTMVNEEL